jgi:hypothetical protein
MRIAFIILALGALAAPALADDYPVSGRWGVTPDGRTGAIDCAGKRVIDFEGNQRKDSDGGVPAYRNESVTNVDGDYRIVDQFTTGQISNGRANYTLRQVDNNRLEMTQQNGATLTLQRCR